MGEEEVSASGSSVWGSSAWRRRRAAQARGKGEGGDRIRLWRLAKPGLPRTAESAVSSKPPKSSDFGLAGAWLAGHPANQTGSGCIPQA